MERSHFAAVNLVISLLLSLSEHNVCRQYPSYVIDTLQQIVYVVNRA